MQALRYLPASKKLRKILWLKNWPSVIGAARLGRATPPLQLRNGLRITHGEGDIPNALFDEIFLTECYTRNGLYEPAPDHCVVDIGSNIGFFALYLQARARGIQVHCFEPAASTRTRLEKNIRENQLAPWVTIHPYGVLDRECELSLGHSDVTGNHTLFDSKEGSETIRCISFDQALKRVNAKTVHLLKMDIEGAEVDAFRSVTPQTLSNVQRIAMEYHENLRPGSLAPLREKLASLGFTHQLISPDPHGSGVGILQASRQAWSA
jgi:FkbM family methyltransferase